LATGTFNEHDRGTNILDSGAHMYDVYRCADGEYISIGSLEPAFYAELLARLGLADDPEFAQEHAQELWPKLTARLAEIFVTRTRAEWCAELEMTDVCFAPVLTMSEAYQHPHNQARDSIVMHDGVLQPAPAPRFSRTVSAIGSAPANPGDHTRAVLADWGFAPDELERLEREGAIRQAH
jgi:alpha-methylacyl-CoA racemase